MDILNRLVSLSSKIEKESWETYFNAIEGLMEQPMVDSGEYVEQAIMTFPSLIDPVHGIANNYTATILYLSERLVGVTKPSLFNRGGKKYPQQVPSSVRDKRFAIVETSIRLFKEKIHTSHKRREERYNCTVNDECLLKTLWIALIMKESKLLSLFLETFNGILDPNAHDFKESAGIAYLSSREILIKELAYVGLPLIVFLCTDIIDFTPEKWELCLTMFKDKIDLSAKVGLEILVALDNSDGPYRQEIIKQKLDLLEKCLPIQMRHIDVNYQNEEKQETILWQLFKNKNIDRLRLFLERFGSRMDFNVQNVDGNTVLMTLASQNIRKEELDDNLSDCFYIDIEEEELNIQDRVKFMKEALVLIREPQFGLLETIKLDTRNGKGETLAHIAAQCGTGKGTDAQEMLPVIHSELKHRHDPNVFDAEGKPLLYYAACNYHPDFIQELLEHPQLDISMKNKYQQDIMDFLTPNQIKEARNVSLIKAAYTCKKNTHVKNRTKEEEPFKLHLDKMYALIESLHVSANEKAFVRGQLKCFEEAVHSACSGRTQATGMSVMHRRKLQGCRVMLLEELTPSDGLLDYLHQDDILTQDQLDEVKTCQTRRKQAEQLLAMLPYCGEKAFECFIKALRETNKDWIADALDKFDPDASPEYEGDNEGALVPVARDAGQTVR